MAERYFSKFFDAANFAKEFAVATGTSLQLRCEENGWKVSVPDDFRLPDDEDQSLEVAIYSSLGRYRARAQGDCGSCQHIKKTGDGLTCRALNKPVCDPEEPIECAHFLAAILHLSHEARSVEREMLKRAENIHFHPQIPDNAPGKYFNKIKRK